MKEFLNKKEYLIEIFKTFVLYVLSVLEDGISEQKGIFD
jgi:hypothetical protein